MSTLQTSAPRDGERVKFHAMIVPLVIVVLLVRRHRKEKREVVGPSDAAAPGGDLAE